MQNQTNNQTPTATATQKYISPLQEKPSSLFIPILLCVLILLVFGFVLFTALVGVVEVNQSSMNPALHHQQLVLQNRNPRNIARLDVVTVSTPPHFQEQNINLFIKRVVATGGDRIKFRLENPALGTGSIVHFYLMKYGTDIFVRQDHSSLINGEMRFGNHFNALRLSFTNGELIIPVPMGYMYLLGDNRNNSIDSRQYGPFSLSSINGRMFTALQRGSFTDRFFRVVF